MDGFIDVIKVVFSFIWDNLIYINMLFAIIVVFFQQFNTELEITFIVVDRLDLHVLGDCEAALLVLVGEGDDRRSSILRFRRKHRAGDRVRVFGVLPARLRAGDDRIV